MEPSLCSVDEAVQLSDGGMGHTMCVVEFVSKAAPVVQLHLQLWHKPCLSGWWHSAKGGEVQ